VFKTLWLPLYIAFLKGIYDRHLAFLTIDTLAAMSPAVRITISLFIHDFLHYVHHVVRHRVTILWYFHMIHHSQRQMNVFTDARVHSAEYLATKAVMFIPMFMLQLELPSIVWISLALHWYTGVYHANLKTNYGWLRHVMVTPQSHRIHHSLDPKHYDKNFGVLFTLWDRAFGTLYPHYDEYPDTGLDDPNIPLEENVAGLGMFTTYVAQVIYPFRLVIGWCVRRLRPAS
jgi:sterol desaturase/sphingolipid hydroxylase (fatty acid hydroxylase superfamily)